MGFSFDFTGERNVIVYQAEAGMVLDENIYRLLKKSQRFVIVSKENNIFKRKGWNEHGFITGMA